MIFYFLLLIHAVCGSICMACSIAAIVTQKGGLSHRKYGRYFFYCMTGIFLTAIPMALIKSNTFLFLIAIFSYYLAYSGWRYAKRKESNISKSDWIICITMILASTIMLMIGLWNFKIENTQSIVLLVFGVLGSSISINDAKLYYKAIISNKIRITKHLGAMLGSTIAVFTAFLVTNINIAYPILLWLSPTIVFTPFIIYWSNRVAE